MAIHLLNANEVASCLNVSRSMVFALIQRGDLPSVRFGRCIRVRPEDLANFIEQNHSANNKNSPTAVTVRESTQVTPRQ